MMIKEAWFQCALKIYFQSDFDVNEITHNIGIRPHIAKRLSESGSTRVGNKKLPGRWEYYDPTKYMKSMSLNQALVDFFCPFSEEKVKRIKEITQNHQGKVLLVINIYFYHACLPEMVFGENIMRIIHELKANIDINMNEEV